MSTQNAIDFGPRGWGSIDTAVWRLCTGGPLKAPVVIIKSGPGIITTLSKRGESLKSCHTHQKWCLLHYKNTGECGCMLRTVRYMRVPLSRPQYMAITERHCVTSVSHTFQWCAALLYISGIYWRKIHTKRLARLCYIVSGCVRRPHHKYPLPRRNIKFPSTACKCAVWVIAVMSSESSSDLLLLMATEMIQ